MSDTDSRVLWSRGGVPAGRIELENTMHRSRLGVCGVVQRSWLIQGASAPSGDDNVEWSAPGGHGEQQGCDAIPEEISVRSGIGGPPADANGAVSEAVVLETTARGEPLRWGCAVLVPPEYRPECPDGLTCVTGGRCQSREYAVPSTESY